MTFKFPRETIKVGDCIAVTYNYEKKKIGEPRLTKYPAVEFEGKRIPGHRLSYHLNKEKVELKPGGTHKPVIRHTCDNAWCVNPEHLVLGTQSENVKDAHERHPTRSIYKHSEGARAKMSKSRIGNKNGRGSKGIRRSEQTKKKMSEAAYRRWERERKEKGPEEISKRMSAVAKGQKLSGEGDQA
jgi:hypothetical protein